jgi:hypothetical protein
MFLFQWLRNNLFFDVYFWLFAQNREISTEENIHQNQYLSNNSYCHKSWLKNSVSHMACV